MSQPRKPKSSETTIGKTYNGISLKGGLTVDESAYWLCLDLNVKGWDLTRDGSKLRLVPIGPSKPTELTESDRELIAKWKPELLQIADYLTTEIATA